jgi:hypothetical protein
MKYTIRFDKDGKPFKADTNKIPCGISDGVVGVLVLCCVILFILIIIGIVIYE